MGKKAKGSKKSKGSRRGGGGGSRNHTRVGGGSTTVANNGRTMMTTESGFEFPIPPRTPRVIIGRIKPDMRPRREQIEELYYSLKYEIESEERKTLVEHQSKVVINEENDDLGICKKDKIRKTYETKEMSTIGTITPLLFGLTKRRPFLFSRMQVPSQDVVCLRDYGLGESDRMVHWNGDCILVMEFKGLFPCVFIGECYLTKKDLWNLAVKFRPGTMKAPGNGKGKFCWPAYQSVLQCPFCAKLACPLPNDEDDDCDDEDDDTTSNRRETFIMVSQNLVQASGCNFGIGNLVRLVCQDCFKYNIRKDNDPDWGTYEAAVSRFAVNRFTGPIGAYDLSQLFETSGMCATVSKFVGEQMQHMGAGSSRKSFKMSLSKSRTKKNRGQHVIKMKRMPTCAACGIQHENNQACAACQKVYYCGGACQKRHWKYHKACCGKATDDETSETPKPSDTILVYNKKKPYPHKCPKCNTYPGDSGTPAICMRCGVFISCGPCFGKPENGGNNGAPVHLGVCCDSCQIIHDNGIAGTLETSVGHLLMDLLEKKPTGYHVPHVRLMLAQMMANQAAQYTGIPYDREAAIEEYLWLANDCDFAPAQYVMGCLHNPATPHQVRFLSGPCPIYTLRGIKEPPRAPFPVNSTKARMYLDRAAEQNFELAVAMVGFCYKNGHGELYPNFPLMSTPYLERAAALGNAKAITIIASDHVSRDELDKATPLFLKAAELGYYAAMFYVIQLGLNETNAEYFVLGKKYLAEIDKIEVLPPEMKHIPPQVKRWKKGYAYFENMVKNALVQTLPNASEDDERVRDVLGSDMSSLKIELKEGDNKEKYVSLCIDPNST